MRLQSEALLLHSNHKGKLGVHSKVPVMDREDLSLVYSPGVAIPCQEIYANYDKIYDYTMKGNMVAVVSDGSAVLGLGNIGPGAALPVMEGKAILFKQFANVEAFPVCLNTNDIDEFVHAIKLMEHNFGGVNLEDIAAPNCFIIEKKLKETLNIPVFHDDQHGTAIVTIAALLNALRLVNKRLQDVKIVINGAGSAGIAIVHLLKQFHAEQIVLCDSSGAIYEGRQHGMNPIKHEVAKITNRTRETGSLADVIRGADVFLGVSIRNVMTEQMVKSMNEKPIVFAMANPEPEIIPEKAEAAGAYVIGTGRSDYPNQVNNVLAFPGIFRGALDARATDINKEMMVAATYAIASLVLEDELRRDYIIPDLFDKRVVQTVSQAVYEAAIASGVSQID